MSDDVYGIVHFPYSCLKYKSHCEIEKCSFSLISQGRHFSVHPYLRSLWHPVIDDEGWPFCDSRNVETWLATLVRARAGTERGPGTDFILPEVYKTIPARSCCVLWKTLSDIVLKRNRPTAFLCCYLVWNLIQISQ